MVKKSGKWYQYTGAIHIHTTESDGTKTLDEVVAIGRDVGLDFMMFSDHMTLSNREAGKEGFYGKTLVTIGYEHNDTDDIHHYLLFDSPGVYPADMSPAEYVAAGAADNALGILAHPDEVRDALKEHPPYPWKDWSVVGFNGIELWNQMSEWMEKLTRYNKLAMAFSPRKSMVAPTERILKKWDELNMTGKYVGIAGVDAHAFPVKVWPFTVEIFPYKVHFKSLRCYILLPEPMSRDFLTARHQFYDAIRDCRLFFANIRWGNADSFEFYGEDGEKSVVCGGSLALTENTRLIIQLPSRATLCLIHNGRKVLETISEKLEFNVGERGIYRVEVWKKKRGWIFSNHIRVGC
ncbi:MAG: histidinol-phosphatase [candidate division Zixibacteria bacterium]|nr:histidinol-phosphatase [candidate division Zixibacteria bacterium]